MGHLSKSLTSFGPHPTEWRSCDFRPRESMIVAPVGSNGLPRRKGSKPRTFRGPPHLQTTGHGDPKYLNQLIDEVLAWPQVESTLSVADHRRTISIRLKKMAAAGDPSAFITGTEFARVLLETPTIYLALPFESAHWAMFRGWAEPHYLQSYGMMSVSTLVVYTPRDKKELDVCYFLFSQSYRFACKLVPQQTIENFQFKEPR